MEILVIHAHWHNRGDELALVCMVRALNRTLPSANITMMMMTSSDVEFPLPDVHTIQAFPSSPLELAAQFPIELIDTLVTVITAGRHSVTRRGSIFLESLRRADVVIHAPSGANIGDIYARGELLYLYRILIASCVFHKPVFIYAPSLGPFRRKSMRWFRRLLLERCSPIVVRDVLSRNYLIDDLGIESVTTADSAFQYESNAEQTCQLSELLGCSDSFGPQRKTVGFVLTDFRWHPVNKHVVSRGRVVSAFGEFGRSLVERGYRVILIPHTFGRLEDDALLDEVAARIGDECTVFPSSGSAERIELLIGTLEMLVSMRYHPAVMATKKKVPFIPVAYEHKYEAFLEDLRMNEYGVPLSDLSAESLDVAFDRVLSDASSIRIALSQHHSRLEYLSSRTNDYLLDLLRQRSLI